ncbi:MAG: glycosyltransferase [Muribaculaceae bacterium]|nr:glycosyltransferase [Muribaculaceae bacterium]
MTDNQQDTQQDVKPSITVIVAVYNHFEWLNLILDALRMQTDKDFEVIIADDGSNEETVSRIQAYMERHPELPVVHSWQPDEGWRKNKSLNKAVKKARGEYLVFVDGDCIPHPLFIADHRKLQKRGRVFGGRRVDMPKSVSDMVEGWDSLPEDYFEKVRKAILSHNDGEPFFESLKQLRRTVHFPFIFGHALGLRSKGFWGCNMGIYKEDLESLNGFDERYLFPGTGEDTDLEVRVRNAGMEYVKSSRYALMLHRRHNRLPLDSPENKKLLQEAIDNHTTWVEKGLNQKPE